jgi:TM2 domain-containing membrane protein YozV
MANQKNQLGAFALALFFGVFGVHRFYLGKNIAIGIIQLILTLTFFGIFISAVWAMIDAIRIAFGNLK